MEKKNFKSKAAHRAYSLKYHQVRKEKEKLGWPDEAAKELSFAQGWVCELDSASRSLENPAINNPKAKLHIQFGFLPVSGAPPSATRLFNSETPTEMWHCCWLCAAGVLLLIVAARPLKELPKPKSTEFHTYVWLLPTIYL